MNISSIAREVKHAQDNALNLEPITSRYVDFDLPLGYQVADAIHALRLSDGITPVGRKIGFTNPDLWPIFGVDHPVWAYLYESTVIQVSGTHVKCNISRFVAPKIEPEIIVHFAKQPPVNADSAQLIDCIDWIAHGFEIVQSHYPDWKFKAADTIADSGLHARLLVGEHRYIKELGPNLIDQLKNCSVSLSCNDKELEVGRGSNVLGSPLGALTHLLRIIAGQPSAAGIQSGEIVTTGSLTKAYGIQSGEVWSTVVSGIDLPGLTVEFVGDKAGGVL